VPAILAVRNRRSGRPFPDDELADLAQDVVVIAWRRLPDFAGLSEIEGWAYGICTFEFKNALRRRSAARSRRVELPEVDPATAEDRSWQFEHVHSALARIREAEADVIRLRHFEGLQFAEISGALGISTNTAKARYYRGLDHLRPLLAAERKVEVE